MRWKMFASNNKRQDQADHFDLVFWSLPMENQSNNIPKMGAVTCFVPQKIKQGTQELTDVLRTALDRINDKRIIIEIYLKDLRVGDEENQKLAIFFKFLAWTQKII